MVGAGRRGSRYLEIVVEGYDVGVVAGDTFEDGDLVADEVLPALHELFVDDLAGIVFAGLDVDGFLDDRIGAAADGLACAVLGAVSGGGGRGGERNTEQVGTGMVVDCGG